ncbi:MAG: radical SAM protein [Planctomycetota bacterium]|jgi:radical SAM protein with 4Fe4S-binding SPASM domain
MKLQYLKIPYYLVFKPLKVGIRPLHLQVEPTDACNQKCGMCYRDRLIEKPARMTLEQFQHVIDEVRPTNVNISGLGEPLLHKDIFQMVRYAKAKGIGVTFPTNLTLAHKKVDELVESGIDVLKVSLDATTAETYHKIRGTDHFDRVVETLQAINALKAENGLEAPHIRINYALQKHNLHELLDMVSMAGDLKAEAIYIQYLDYVDVDDLKDELVGEMSAIDLKGLLTEARALAKSKGIETNIAVWLRDLEIYHQKMNSMGKRLPLERKCYYPWITTFIEANGDVKACPIFTRKRGEARLGNIFEQPFDSIWNGEAYIELRRQLRAGGRPTAPCRQCVPQSLSNIFMIFSKMLPGWKI